MKTIVEPAKPHLNVAVLVYNGVELVDMNGPIDVFLHANWYTNSRYTVYTVAAAGGVVLSEDKVVSINPGYTFANCPDPDIIVIPGIISGQFPDPYNEKLDPSIVPWLQKMAAAKKAIMSVCIGAYVLAKTGLLSGKKATTHYLSIDDFHKHYPDITIVKNVRCVEDGLFVTTGGVTSGIDGALYLIGKLDGPIVAQQVADVMVYNREAPLPPFTILPPYYS